MVFKPHEYQQRAIRWVIDHPRCCLFLDMGLGKSVITLTAIKTLIEVADIERALVVAPKKVADSTWTDEADKWDHLSNLSVVNVKGTTKQREEALQSAADVYVIWRDNFVWLMERYGGKLPYDMIIIDELTSFKSPSSKRFKAMKLATPTVSRMVGLTGTPAPNGLVDLWAQMYCIDMGQRLGKFVSRYRSTYFNEQTWNHIVIRCTPKPGAEAQIRKQIADICLSMQAKDYLQLPPLMVQDDRISLPPELAEDYRRFERDRVMEFVEEHGDESPKVMADNAAALMNKLSQYASGAIYDDEHKWHELHREKTERLAEIMEGVSSGVLVFYQYKHEAERILRDLKGYKPRLYRDSEDLRAWNNGEVRLMLAHPASTAYGLNMQRGGHTAVWYGTGWNLELYQQANARLHRQGQQRPVTVVRLITAGTVDERAAKALDLKRSTQQALLDSLKTLKQQYGKR